ncbi:MAG TPA: TauD/TfdA family dioxygenase [Bryobacteraceae bacterium]|nr:TauD/TfdA family dioxygenase [Bryobacteraceae bacterium]
MQITHSAAPLGTEITGLDLSQPLDEATFRAVEDLFHDRGVIVFRDQKLTPEQHIAFSRRLGKLEIHVATQYLKPGYPEILVVSNVIEDGRNIGLADAGQYWHSDLSYIANPSRCSLLYALDVPIRDGVVLGETLFASAAYAYETLPQSLKERLEGVTAIHRYGDRYQKQQSAGGRGALSEEQLKKVPDVRHAVIRQHPITGREVIFVNEGFTTAIEGLAVDEGAVLLQQLFAHIVRPETLYTHRWRAGDVLMWDNCLTQHRAIRNYELPLRRVMHRTTVAGV